MLGRNKDAGRMHLARVITIFVGISKEAFCLRRTLLTPARAVSLSQHKREWDDLSVLLASSCWAILSDNDRKFGRWNVDAFFQTGEDEISSILAIARQFGRPQQHLAALDFGCGVGRLSKALKRSFQDCVGVDISESMIRKARELNADCQFTVLEGTDLKMFSNGAVRFCLQQHSASTSAALLKSSITSGNSFGLCENAVG